MANDYATLKKGGFMKQRQKDRFSLRLSIVGGQVSAEQLAVITEVAKQYGHGYVHLTSRQSIEIPYIKLEDVDKVKDALAEGGVAPGVCGPRVRTITACQGMVRVRLHTGRTHQIRCQFASRGWPLAGERKYSTLGDPCELALFSAYLGFHHPISGKWTEFSQFPPNQEPWNRFECKFFVK